MTKELKTIMVKGKIKPVPSDHPNYLQWLIATFSDPDLEPSFNPSSRFYHEV